MYRPLWRVDAARGLEHANESRLGVYLASVVKRTLVEPLRERRLATNIASAGPVCDPVSRRVRDQYESSPYPRWLRIAAMDRSPVADSLKRRFSHWKPARAFGTGSRALVLGCGTGYEPIELALREPEFRVIAVDLSLASLAYATRMAEDLGVRNIRFLHGDILNLRNYRRQLRSGLGKRGAAPHARPPRRVGSGVVEARRGRPDAGGALQRDGEAKHRKGTGSHPAARCPGDAGGHAGLPALSAAGRARC